MTGRFSRDPCVTHIARWAEQQGKGLQPDRREAERFLESLDPDADGFSFRTFSDTGYTRSGNRDPLEKAIHGSLSDCWDELVRLNRQGAVITVTINRTTGEGRSVADIRRVRALFIDDDLGGDPARLNVAPHIRVETSENHYHYYWRVKDLPLTLFTEYQQKLARRYGGDSRVQVVNQSMQLPGFWRRKALTRPRLPRLLHASQGPPLSQRQVAVLIGSG